MMQYEKILMAGSWFCTAVASVITDITQVLGLVVIVLNLVMSIINTVVPLIRKAKADGKVTIDEVIEIAEEVTDVIEDGKEMLEKTEAEQNGKSN